MCLVWAPDLRCGCPEDLGASCVGHQTDAQREQGREHGDQAKLRRVSLYEIEACYRTHQKDRCHESVDYGDRGSDAVLVKTAYAAQAVARELSLAEQKTSVMKP